MENDYYLNTRLLRDHVLDLNEEKRLAHRLCETLKMARDLSDPELRAAHNQALSSSEKLVLYFGKMAESLETISNDADKLYQRIRTTLQDETDQLRSKNNRMML